MDDWSLLECCGIMFIIISVGTLLIMAYWIIREWFENIIYTYKYKHGFDKPPIAKCYCKDCKLWEPGTGKCYDPCNSRYMGEGWFCCFAEPADKDDKRYQKEKEVK